MTAPPLCLPVNQTWKNGKIRGLYLWMGEHVIQDYAALALSLKAHPVHFTREKLKLLNVLPAEEINNSKEGITVETAGLVLVRPGTAGGICFVTIEDETGVGSLMVFKKLFNHYRKEI